MSMLRNLSRNNFPEEWVSATPPRSKLAFRETSLRQVCEISCLRALANGDWPVFAPWAARLLFFLLNLQKLWDLFAITKV